MNVYLESRQHLGLGAERSINVSLVTSFSLPALTFQKACGMSAWGWGWVGGVEMHFSNSVCLQRAKGGREEAARHLSI